MFANQLIYSTAKLSVLKHNRWIINKVLYLYSLTERHKHTSPLLATCSNRPPLECCSHCVANKTNSHNTCCESVALILSGEHIAFCSAKPFLYAPNCTLAPHCPVHGTISPAWLCVQQRRRRCCCDRPLTCRKLADCALSAYLCGWLQENACLQTNSITR